MSKQKLMTHFEGSSTKVYWTLRKGPTGRPETQIHNCQYAFHNNKDDRHSHRQQYGALLNWKKLKLRHNKYLCQCCVTDSISNFTSQVRQIYPLTLVTVLEAEMITCLSRSGSIFKYTVLVLLYCVQCISECNYINLT